VARNSAGSYSVDAATLAPGTYTARAEQSDAAGNFGYSAPVTFTITGADTVAPVVSLDALTSSTTDTTPVLSGSGGTASGDTSTVTVRLYSGGTASGTAVQSLNATRAPGGAYSVEAAALSPGTYTARAEQSDAAGNTGFSPSRTFTVSSGGDNAAPAVTLQSPDPGSFTLFSGVPLANWVPAFPL